MGALLYFILLAGLFFLMMRFGCGSHVMGHGHGARGDKPGDRGRLRWTPPDSDIDPVCGKTVRPDQAKSSVHDGVVYYFCSRDCREQFEAAPDQYAGRSFAKSKHQMEPAHGQDTSQHTHA